jgi:hypothetical protein
VSRERIFDQRERYCRGRRIERVVLPLERSADLRADIGAQNDGRAAACATNETTAPRVDTRRSGGIANATAGDAALEIEAPPHRGEQAKAGRSEHGFGRHSAFRIVETVEQRAEDPKEQEAWSRGRTRTASTSAPSSTPGRSSTVTRSKWIGSSETKRFVERRAPRAIAAITPRASVKSVTTRSASPNGTRRTSSASVV